MPTQILSVNQFIEIDVTGGTTYKKLVCTSSSSVNTTLGTSQDQTTCGVLTAVGDASMTIDFDAVCEAQPTTEQISYEELLSASVNKVLVNCRVQNPAVTGSSAGQYYYHQFKAYITDLSLNMTVGEYVKFSGTITSSGALDIDVL
jgi:hypothetical protein